MITPVGYNIKNNYYNKQNNRDKNNNNISFKANPEVAVFKNKIMKIGRKKFTGELMRDLGDNLLLIMDFQKGILQRATKILEITDPQELAKIKGRKKNDLAGQVLYSKSYRYSSSGELMEVERNNKTVFKKEYSFEQYNLSMPIKRTINDSIEEFFDTRNRKVVSTNYKTGVFSTFHYDDGVVLETRRKFARNPFLYSDGELQFCDRFPDVSYITDVKKYVVKWEDGTQRIVWMNKYGLPGIIKERAGKTSGTNNITYFTYDSKKRLRKKSTEFQNGMWEVTYLDTKGREIKSRWCSGPEAKGEVHQEFSTVFNNEGRVASTYQYFAPDKINGFIGRKIYTTHNPDGTCTINEELMHKNGRVYKTIENLSKDEKTISFKCFNPEGQEMSVEEFMQINDKAYL